MSATDLPMPAAADDATNAARLAMLADRRMGEAVELLADWLELYFSPAQSRDPDQMRKVQSAMVAVAHARELVGPLMVERSA